MRQFWKIGVMLSLSLLVLISGAGLTTYVHTCHMMARTDVGLSPKKCCGEKPSGFAGDELKSQCCDHETRVNRTVQYSPEKPDFQLAPVFALVAPLMDFAALDFIREQKNLPAFPRPPDPGGRTLLNLFQVYRI